MYLLLIGLIVLAALLMCFVVLIQNSKGGGLASSFASSNQIWVFARLQILLRN